MSTQDFTVVGMTCAHCVRAVTEEVEQVAGVTAVEVDLESGRLTVRGETVGEAAIRAAVVEAGYSVSP